MTTIRASAVLLSFAGLSLAFVACTTETVVTQAPAAVPDAEAPAEETPSADAGASADAAATVDAAPPPSENVVVRSGVGQSCNAVCAKPGYTCAPVCQFGSSSSAGKLAGQAVYSNTKNSFTSYDYEPLSTCTQTAPATVNMSGTIYQPEYGFGSPLSCCCQAPGHYRLDGNAKAPTSCADVCKAAGHTCDTKTSFGDQFGAGQLEYACPGSTLFTIADACTTIPTKTKVSGSDTCTLSAFTCGCL